MTYLHFILGIVIITSLESCISSKQVYKPEELIIDPTISTAAIYNELDKQDEILSFMEKSDSFPKRSSDVTYSPGKNIIYKSNIKNYNCRAYYFPFFHADTLLINIGSGNGFAGRGFIINYKDNRFYVKPYYYTCTPSKENVEYKLIYQKLILDKPKYKEGDSLYGKVDFKIIENNKYRKQEHKGEGYFRAKVTKM